MQAKIKDGNVVVECTATEKRQLKKASELLTLLDKLGVDGADAVREALDKVTEKVS